MLVFGRTLQFLVDEEKARKPWRAGSVVVARFVWIWLDQKSGILQGGADPRRNACAIGR